MRIAIGGMAHESCTFSPLPTRMEDFRVVRGEAMRERYPFLEGLAGVEVFPLLHASALPGGVVDAAAYAQFAEELLAALRQAGPWDGVYLDMHGAMSVQGMEDAEGHFVAAVREVVGADCLLAASYDLHGNVSQRVVDGLDVLTAYRTAPHEDGAETRARAWRLLVDCLRQGVRPHLAFVPVPITLPGECAMTTAEPAASLYAQIPAVAARAGVLDASILVGYTWADEPRVGATTIGVARDADAARQAAQDLARAFWEARHGLGFSMVTGSVDECIALALAESEPGVFISDAGDNVTGGGVGDVPAVLGRLLHHRVPDAIYASLADARAVVQCAAAGVGAQVSLSLGGKLDPIHGQPLEVAGRVIRVVDLGDQGRQAVVQIDGVQAILTEQRAAFTDLIQFEQLGIEPARHRIVVVKLGYLFPELRQVARLSLLAYSPGAIDPDVTRLPYRRVRRPIYPLDPEMEWEPG